MDQKLLKQGNESITVKEAVKRTSDKLDKMGSINAKNVALDVIKAVRNGTNVNLKQIQLDNGYTESSAQAHKAIKTKTFRRTLAKYDSKALELLKTINLKQFASWSSKLDDINAGTEKATIRDLAYSFDISQKHINLFEGKSNVNISVKHEITTVEQADEYLDEVLN